MLERHHLFALAAVALIASKILLFYLLYNYTYKIEASAKYRKMKRLAHSKKMETERIAKEDEVKESQTKEILQSINRSLRKNFSILSVLLLLSSIDIF